MLPRQWCVYINPSPAMPDEHAVCVKDQDHITILIPDAEISMKIAAGLSALLSELLILAA